MPEPDRPSGGIGAYRVTEDWYGTSGGPGATTGMWAPPSKGQQTFVRHAAHDVQTLIRYVSKLSMEK